MAKLLKLKDYLRIGLALGGDFYNLIRESTGLDLLVKRETYGWVPDRYHPSSRLRATQNLLTTREIEKVIKGNEIFYRLTGKGQKAIQRDFPILRLKHKRWDGFWTVVFFDVPENKRFVRRILTQKLKSLGFGMMQRSVYISPFDLAEDLGEFYQQQRLEDWVFVSRAERVLAGDDRKLAKKVWPLAKVNGEYESLLKDLEESQKTSKGLSTKTSDFRSRYLEILVRDPLLPEALLPENWLGDKARKTITSLR